MGLGNPSARRTTTLQGQSLWPCERCYIQTKGKSPKRSNRERDSWAWWLKHPPELREPQIHIPVVSQAEQTCTVSQVLGEWHVSLGAGEWEEILLVFPITRNSMLNLTKSLGSTFFWTPRISVKSFSFNYHVFLTTPHPRVFNRLWLESVLQHCFITPN